MSENRWFGDIYLINKEDIIMPRGDGTGPMGMGPMTGRTAGFCADYETPGYMNPILGRGFGMGDGQGRRFGEGGRGRRNLYYATGLPGWMRFGGNAAPNTTQIPIHKSDPEAEKQALKNQAETLQSQLDAVKKHLEEFESGSAESQ